jgi:apolipoprotein N-acyltransferase
MTIRTNIKDFKITLSYLGPIGPQRCFIIAKWLEDTIGKEGYDWLWLGYSISLDDPEVAIVLKLKFGL